METLLRSLSYTYTRVRKGRQKPIVLAWPYATFLKFQEFIEEQYGEVTDELIVEVLTKIIEQYMKESKTNPKLDEWLRRGWEKRDKALWRKLARYERIPKLKKKAKKSTTRKRKG